jgi:hypothetical protein
VRRDEIARAEAFGPEGGDQLATIIETLDRASTTLEDENIAVGEPRGVHRVVKDILLFAAFELPDLPGELQAGRNASS